MAAVDGVPAYAKLLDDLATSDALAPDERIAELRRLRGRILDARAGLDSVDDGYDDLGALAGHADSYIGSLELQREAAAMGGALDRAVVREDAEVRDLLIAQGVATADELDAAGWPSHEQLDAMEADGTLSEALVGMGKGFGLGVLTGTSFNQKVKRDHGKFSKTNVAGASQPGPGAPAAPKPAAPKLASRGAERAKVKLPPAAAPPLGMAPAPAVPTPDAPAAPKAAAAAAKAKRQPAPLPIPAPPEDQWIDVGSDVTKAADLLAKGQYVRLSQPREASVLLGELARRVQEAKAAGDSAPSFDLCKITVKGTNLFCAESKGIPRVQMPQLGGVPLPGSPASKLVNDRGKADLSGQFREHLAAKGVKITEEHEKASHLRASQIELNGGKVAGMVQALEAGKKLGSEKPIFVSHDNYIVDGHHRWAANVGHDLADGQLGDIDMPVSRVDMDIVELLAEANQFAADMGIPQQGVHDETAAKPAAAKLPEQGDAYFNTDPKALAEKYGVAPEQVQEVPLDQITPIRARPEGIANARPHMANAAAGTGGKRDPITLVKQADGGYKVYDGNSTFAIASQEGWAKLPAIVVGSDAEGAQVEKIAKAAKSAAKAGKNVPSLGAPGGSGQLRPTDPAAPPNPRDATGTVEPFRGGRAAPDPAAKAKADAAVKSMFRPGEEKVPEQHFGSLDELYQAAQADGPEFERILTQEVGGALGASVPTFEKAIAQSASDAPGTMVLMGPLKGKERAMEKISANYDGDHNQLKDVVRATILVPTAGEVPGAMDAVREHFEKAGWQVRGAKDRFSEDGPPPPSVKGPTSAGYSDVALALVSPNGVATELQFNMPKMFLAKEGDGHKLYEQQRSLEAQIQERMKTGPTGGGLASPGGPTAEESALLDSLREQQMKLYGEARLAAYG